MADTKLSALTEMTVTPAATDELYLNDGGTSKKITYETLLPLNKAWQGAILESHGVTVTSNGDSSSRL